MGGVSAGPEERKRITMPSVLARKTSRYRTWFCAKKCFIDMFIQMFSTPAKALSYFPGNT